MNILIYGGTRFIGAGLVNSLLSSGHHLTVVSRRSLPVHPYLTCITGERDDCYRHLVGKEFDHIIDFMAYDADAVNNALKATPQTPYFFLSTIWIQALEKGQRNFLDYEEAYVRRKIAAEIALKEKFDEGLPVTICRLPITLGADDHTERFKFYAYRVFNGFPIRLPDGGLNHMRICYREDVIKAIHYFVENQLHGTKPIYEAKPDRHITLADLVTEIGEALDRKPNIITAPAQSMSATHKDYLAYEPLWREVDCFANFDNFYTVTGMSSTPYEEWITHLAKDKYLVSASGQRPFMSEESLKTERELSI